MSPDVGDAPELVGGVGNRGPGRLTTSDPGQQVAYSPTYCSRVQLGDDGKMEWVRLYYPTGDIGNSMKEGTWADAPIDDDTRSRLTTAQTNMPLP